LPSPNSLGATLARQSRDSAADQKVLDTLHRGVTPSVSEPQPDGSAAPAPVVRGEDVQKEAEQLFGSKDGKQAVGAAPPTGEPLFDIDVTTFGTNRRVLDYLEFFQVDARDRFEIWLQRLGRYEGMIRERFRAKGLPEDLVYLTLVERDDSNTAVSRHLAIRMSQLISRRRPTTPGRGGSSGGWRGCPERTTRSPTTRSSSSRRTAATCGAKRATTSRN
jgi:hypothetical protein